MLPAGRVTYLLQNEEGRVRLKEEGEIKGRGEEKEIKVRREEKERTKVYEEREDI
jgi:LEA14-like dessication related protein